MDGAVTAATVVVTTTTVATTTTTTAKIEGLEKEGDLPVTITTVEAPEVTWRTLPSTHSIPPTITITVNTAVTTCHPVRNTIHTAVTIYHPVQSTVITATALVAIILLPIVLTMQIAQKVTVATVDIP